VSSIQALEGKEKHVTEMVARSGYSELEVYLERLFTEERGLMVLRALAQQVVITTDQLITMAQSRSESSERQTQSTRSVLEECENIREQTIDLLHKLAEIIRSD
jgi:hypothetical protein